jgi:DNA-binding LacI/PurR family transcriptional regulator
VTNIKDVARHANVSMTTVSHVLNGRGRVAEETRRRVLEAAKELGYTANPHARQLVTRRSRILLIQMPDLDGGGESGALVPTSESEYFLELINGAAAAATVAKYALIVVSAGVDPTSMGGFGLDGMIIVDPRGTETVLQAAFGAKYPIVTTGEPVVTASAPSFVVDNDHQKATRGVLNHFVAEGRSQPALITDMSSRSFTRDIVHAYNQWCAEHDVRPAVVAVPDLSPEQMSRALDVLHAGPYPADAIHTSSDGCAIALLNAARAAHVSVPDDLALASAVDSTILRVTNPPVTAVCLHPREIGSQAVQILTELITREEPDCELPPLESTRLLIPTRLELRRSSSGEAAPT